MEFTFPKLTNALFTKVKRYFTNFVISPSPLVVSINQTCLVSRSSWLDCLINSKKMPENQIKSNRRSCSSLCLILLLEHFLSAEIRVHVYYVR